MPTDGDDVDRKAHWQRVYGSKPAESASWFQPGPTVSAKLLAKAGLTPDT